MRRFLLWGPVVGYMGLIFIASSISDVPPLPGGVTDKTAHFWVYGLLAVLTFRALAGSALAGLTPWRALLAVVIAFGYGVSDEIHQSFVPNRSPDVLDVAADTLGALGAVLVVLAIRALVARWPRRPRRL